MFNSSQNYKTESSGLLDGVLYMLKAVVIAYIISILLLFPSALIATFKAFSDKGITITANIITAIGTLFAGLMAGRHFDSKGIFFGAGCGVIYTFLLCLLGNLISKNMDFGGSFLTAAVIGLLCGAVGGIIGINTKVQKRHK